MRSGKKGAGFAELGQQLRQDLARHDHASDDARVRRAVLARQATPRLGPTFRFAFAAGLVAALALGATLWAARGSSEAPLRFWVEARHGQVDEWVTARDVEQSLRFSDGSSVVAGPHTTTRVVQISPEGARLTLERGQLEAHIVPREQASWQVAAGPFAVRVTGSRFRMGWDPVTERLSVAVLEGRAQVSGGGQPEHELLAGSSLELLLSGAVELKSAFELPAAAAAEPADTSAPAATSAEAARDEDELLRARKPAERRSDWRELSTAGHYREALASVEQQGFAAQCAALPARDLLSLGSTARLAGRGDLAREAYQALRRRFPTSSEAAISAFSLGRLASDSGQRAEALGWFRRYLNEQPGGPLAREAWGRLIELYAQQGNGAEARKLAEQYLKQYPSGPHAALARSVLARP
jgi:TolA-binding protein